MVEHLHVDASGSSCFDLAQLGLNLPETAQVGRAGEYETRIGCLLGTDKSGAADKAGKTRLADRFDFLFRAPLSTPTSIPHERPERRTLMQDGLL